MKSKIISFIIGGMIGFCLWSIQVQAWAQPLGYKEMSQVEVDDPESYMEENLIDIPSEVEETCEKYGDEYNICPEILEAICWRESRCTAKAKNGSCKGVMQVNENVHQERMKKLGVKDIYDLDGNIHTATDLLSDLYKDKKSISKALDAYNGNKGNTAYVSDILRTAAALDRIGGD